MDIDDIPVVGKVNRSIDSIVLNFTLLGVVAIVLGLAIMIFPKVLEVLVSVMLIVTALIFFNIAWHISSYKKKYMGWTDKL